MKESIQFVWQDIENTEELDRFLNSGIPWGRFETRVDPSRREVILGTGMDKHRIDDQRPLAPGHVIPIITKKGKSIRFDLKGSVYLLENLINEILFYRVEDVHLWFAGRTEYLGKDGFRLLAGTFPGAILQCPVESIASHIINAPNRALEILNAWAQWGINRFSVDWNAPHMLEMLRALVGWGFEVDISGVPDLESFAGAISLRPCSITLDFDDPDLWRSHSVGQYPERRREPISRPFRARVRLDLKRTGTDGR